MPNAVACRLYVILARDGRSAVVFRRGPRSHLLLLRWWLKDDRFEEGQWVKHKVYVRRCDLSPDGEFLLYFAGRFKGPIYSWSAISRPPYLSALALWPKTDVWGGGGLLLDRHTIGLNHKTADMTHANGLAPHSKYKVIPFSPDSGSGEDHPVENARLLRDGWVQECHGESHYGWRKKSKQFYTVDPPAVLSRENPKMRSIKLSKIHTGGIVEQGKHYVLQTKDGKVLRTFDTFDWADWDTNGDLLLADDGKIWRLPSNFASEAANEPFSGCSLLFDLSDRKFSAITPPFWATTWQPRK